MLPVIKLHLPASLTVWGGHMTVWPMRNKQKPLGRVFFGKTFKWGWLSLWIYFSPLLLSLFSAWHVNTMMFQKHLWNTKVEEEKSRKSWIVWFLVAPPYLPGLLTSLLSFTWQDSKSFFIYLLLFKFPVFNLDLIPAPNQRLSLDIQILHNSTLVHRAIALLGATPPVHRTAMGWLLMEPLEWGWKDKFLGHSTPGICVQWLLAESWESIIFKTPPHAQLC